jgi:hypothetical protein
MVLRQRSCHSAGDASLGLLIFMCTVLCHAFRSRLLQQGMHGCIQLHLILTVGAWPSARGWSHSCGLQHPYSILHIFGICNIHTAFFTYLAYYDNNYLSFLLWPKDPFSFALDLCMTHFGRSMFGGGLGDYLFAHVSCSA